MQDELLGTGCLRRLPQLRLARLVRELENAIERAMVVGKPPVIRPDDLPFQVLGKGAQPASGSLASVEKAHIQRVLEGNRWNISRSADVLKIDRATLYHKIAKYGLKKA